MNLKNRAILVTGGTGSFGKKFVKNLLEKHKPRKVIVFSRDELKQFEMAHELTKHADRLRFFLGDIRDAERLTRAFHGVDVVVHGAALKQVPILEYNPFEAVKTNIIGAENIINAAIDQKVKAVVALSTDKAVNPASLYGATKLCMEKLFVAGNSYSGKGPTKFSVVRYGNVVGSRGSVVPFFLSRKETDILPITDSRMTRFWITLEQAVEMVHTAITHMRGGEIFVPKIPSMKITDLAAALAPGCKVEIIGIRPGEKIHEVLLQEEESCHAVEYPGHFVIQPNHPFWLEKSQLASDGKPLPAGFRYSSDNNPQWLSTSEIRSLVSVKDVEMGDKRAPQVAKPQVKTLTILQARMSSSRLPGKVLKPILGKPMLLLQIERLSRTPGIERLIVATSGEPSDDPIESVCQEADIPVFRGSLTDVLDRFYQAAKTLEATNVIRVTGDCPLTDPQVNQEVIDRFFRGSVDYVSNTVNRTYPIGLDIEMFSFSSLERAWQEAKSPYEREHVTPYFYRHPELFEIGQVTQSPDLSAARWTVDLPDDFSFVKSVYEALYPTKPHFTMSDVLELVCA